MPGEAADMKVSTNFVPVRSSAALKSADSSLASVRSGSYSSLPVACGAFHTLASSSETPICRFMKSAKPGNLTASSVGLRSDSPPNPFIRSVV